jgi:hypothetical protein
MASLSNKLKRVISYGSTPLLAPYEKAAVINRAAFHFSGYCEAKSDLD